MSARVRATSFDGLAEFARLCSRLKKSGAIVRYHKSPSLGFVLELVTEPWRRDSILRAKLLEGTIGQVLWDGMFQDLIVSSPHFED